MRESLISFFTLDLIWLIYLGADFVLVSVGGGGLISGISGYIKNNKNKTASNCKIIGCQPINDNAMEQCILKGSIFDIEV
jgi:threonine dehydratase